ncbi:hypothetical protein J1614_008657 [Plenodomus biglobosus]|nr:hypothetical protein J1614_008657 [Plenodomus biglobosus]
MSTPPPTPTPALRPQPEFFMAGITPIPPTPQDNCPICQEPLRTDAIRIILCSHTFHTTCLHTWLAGHRTCPCCRRNLYLAPCVQTARGRDGPAGGGYAHVYRESAHAYRGSLLRLLERHAASLGEGEGETGYVDVDTNANINGNEDTNVNINANDDDNANSNTNTLYQHSSPGDDGRAAVRSRNSTVEVSFDLRRGYRGRNPVAVGLPLRSTDTNAARVVSLARVRSIDEVTARMGQMRSRGLEEGDGQAEDSLSRGLGGRAEEMEGRGWFGEGGGGQGIPQDTYPGGR